MSVQDHTKKKHERHVYHQLVHSEDHADYLTVLDSPQGARYCSQALVKVSLDTVYS